MEYEQLKAVAETIAMPEDMKHRIIGNCRAQTMNSGKETVMKKVHFRKLAVIAAVLVVCLSLTVAAMAVPSTRKGFFRDVTDWRGAVVGTSYEQATDEIDMTVTVNGEELTVRANFSIPQEFPYREAEKLGIAAYRIVDANRRAVKEGAAESTKVANGQAAILIPTEGIDSGDYKLIVTAFVAEKKADQPLNLNGYWECNFTK